MDLFALALAFVVAITIHEFSHAWTADRLGDPTPRVQGRLSLNPLAHVDLVGTILVPLFLLLLALQRGGGIIFGWAKPVPFDPYNLENPRRDSALISFAGPASNISVALISAAIFHISVIGQIAPSILTALAYPLTVINMLLAIFNLIPVHPLDGGKILVGLLPRDIAYEWDKILQQYGFIILLLLIFPIFGSPLLVAIIGPPLELILSILQLPPIHAYF